MYCVKPLVSEKKIKTEAIGMFILILNNFEYSISSFSFLFF